MYDFLWSILHPHWLTAFQKNTVEIDLWLCPWDEVAIFPKNLVKMSFDFKNKSLILKFLERWVIENFLKIIRIFAINESLKGKC